MYIHRRIWTAPTSQPCNTWRRPSIDIEWHWMFSGNTRQTLTCCWRRRLYWTISCLFSDRENYTFVILADRDHSSHPSPKNHHSVIIHSNLHGFLAFVKHKCEHVQADFPVLFTTNWNQISNLKKTTQNYHKSIIKDLCSSHLLGLTEMCLFADNIFLQF